MTRKALYIFTLLSGFQQVFGQRHSMLCHTSCPVNQPWLDDFIASKQPGPVCAPRAMHSLFRQALRLTVAAAHPHATTKMSPNMQSKQAAMLCTVSQRVQDINTCACPRCALVATLIRGLMSLTRHDESHCLPKSIAPATVRVTYN
jgi:hypothetical protein